MAICVPNFNFQASTDPEIKPLKLLFPEISNLQYSIGFDLNDPMLGLTDSHHWGLPSHKMAAFHLLQFKSY